MKKLFWVLMLASLFLFQVASSGFAYSNSGDLLGIFEGNDNDLSEVYSNIMASAGYTGFHFDLSDFELFAKVDAPFNSTTEGPGTLYITYEPDGQSGTWQTYMAPATSGALLNFYSVKAANAYALYWEDPASDEGTWSTIDLLNQGYGGAGLEISHFSGYTVPIPGALYLLGSGLAGLVVIRRRKYQS